MGAGAVTAPGADPVEAAAAAARERLEELKRRIGWGEGKPGAGGRGE
jgi:hypothetical protein